MVDLTPPRLAERGQSDPSSNAETAEPVPRLALRVKEAAIAIGVSERTLRELLADRTSDIPHMRIGERLVLFPVRELSDWLAAQAGLEKTKRSRQR